MSTNPTIQLEQFLQNLEMTTTSSSGLKWVSDKEKENNPYIYIGLEQANHYKAKAVYFRFFSDGRPPKPQVYIYAFEDLNNCKSNSALIHHRLWNAGVVPLCFIYYPTKILVYNCLQAPEVNQNDGEFVTDPHDIIDLLGDVQEKLSKYSARQFDSGLFWDSVNSQDIKYDQSAYEQLLTQLKNVKKLIISRTGDENAQLIKKVLMMLILIKYLEDRVDEHGQRALEPKEFYPEFNYNNPTLEDILDNNNKDQFFAVLDRLSSNDHFNGQIFSLQTEEKKKLRKIDFELFQRFVKGDTSFFQPNSQAIGQMSFWKLYSFNYLPIELISHIYEDFLTHESGIKKKGVVYTPPYLVQHIIDRSMPLDKPKKNFKVLDPACGSGIFLVGAFKRMIQWWRIRNNWGKPQKKNIEELKELLSNNIYGCDLEDEAVRLTYFSLSLALLDALSPKEIWGNVHFNNLMGKNLFAGDFFDNIQKDKLDKNFDLVLGNPPFESKFTEYANKINSIEQLNDPNRPNVPDEQIALLFLEQSIGLLKENGECCMIIPAGPLLYNTYSHDFKSYLFSNHFFKEIHDFTPLRQKLFISSSSKAKPSVVAVVATKKTNEGNPVYHLIYRRTKASAEKIEFEIDHYDIHQVDYQMAIQSKNVWQINFFGGGRLHQLADRISSMPTLGDYLKNMKLKDGWIYGEGWQECPNSSPIKRIKTLLEIKSRSKEQNLELKKLEKKHKADWITGQDLMETTGIIRKCEKKYFQWPRKRTLFEPPTLTIYENLKKGQIPVTLQEKYITFKDSFFGIHTPYKDKSKLLKLKNFLSNKQSAALIWLSSGKIITMREGVPLMSDILSLPYNESPIQFDEFEKILLDDIMDYYSKFRSEGENSTILNNVTNKELDAFGKFYCRILNSIYSNFKPLAPIKSEFFISFPFILGDKPKIKIPPTIANIENTLKEVINNKTDYNLWMKRILKVYHKNVIFLYKPNQKRYWLKSIAIRDADETFTDLFEQGK